jgi:putative endonuclease
LPEEPKYYVYILTNKANRVLYTGMTDNLPRRAYEHKLKIRECFTNLYNAEKLIYFEELKSLNEAIQREKHIKGWLRKKKIELINNLNPEWRNLTVEISDEF